MLRLVNLCFNKSLYHYANQPVLSLSRMVCVSKYVPSKYERVDGRSVVNWFAWFVQAVCILRMILSISALMMQNGRDSVRLQYIRPNIMFHD